MNNRPLKCHEINLKRPLKRPIVTQEELAFFDPEILKGVLILRTLGYDVIPPKGYPEPPDPQFTNPD